MTRYILFGAGQKGKEMLEILSPNAVACFADNYAHGEKLGKPIISAKELIPAAADHQVVLTVGHEYYDEIAKQLTELGIVFIHGAEMTNGEQQYLIKHRQFDTLTSEGIFAIELGKALKNAQVFADVGAREGDYTLIAAEVMDESGVIYAFDPDPQIWGTLQNNIAKGGYKNIHIMGVATANHNGRMELYSLARQSQNNKALHCFTVDKTISHPRLQKMRENPATIILSDVFPCVKLDDFFNDITPDVMKMDIEGSELFALLGAEKLISRRKTTIFLEVHDAYVNAVDPRGMDKINALFKKYGYKVYLCVGDDGAPHGSEHPQRGGTKIVPVDSVQFEHCIIRPE